MLCELAIVDEKTRNVSAINCFSRRIIEGEIETAPPFNVFATMVGGHGTMPAKLVIERLDTLEATYEKPFTLRFPNSLDEMRALVRVRPIAIPVVGYYQALLIVEGETIAQKRFSITVRQE